MSHRETVRSLALDSYGFVTTTDAVAAGVPAVELRKLASRGWLTNIAYGLYRVPDGPTTPRDQYAEALLRVGRNSYLRGDAVLSLHDLALVNPRRIRVGTPHRVRAHLPAFIDVLQQTLPADQLTVYDGLRATTVARALLDCRGTVMRERLADAVRDAWRRGLLTDAERVRVRRALATKETTA